MGRKNLSTRRMQSNSLLLTAYRHKYGGVTLRLCLPNRVAEVWQCKRSHQGQLRISPAAGSPRTREGLYVHCRSNMGNVPTVRRLPLSQTALSVQIVDWTNLLDWTVQLIHSANSVQCVQSIQ
jgi:hypothetical protein